MKAVMAKGVFLKPPLESKIFEPIAPLENYCHPPRLRREYPDRELDLIRIIKSFNWIYQNIAYWTLI